MEQLFDKIIEVKNIEMNDITSIFVYIHELSNNKISSINGTRLIREFPFVNNFEFEYMNLLMKSFETNKDRLIETVLSVSSCKQVFETTIYFPNELGYIKYLFPIVYAEKLIQQTRMKPTKMLVNELYKFTQFIELSDSVILDNNPVILLDYPFAYPGFFVIDGNHRINNAKEQNRSEINTYLLSANTIGLISASPIYSLLFTMHENLSMILLYLTGIIDLSLLKNEYKVLSKETFII